MTISIVNDFSGHSGRKYVVSFFSWQIHTTVTSSLSAVDDWIYFIEATQRQKFNDELIVGLDIEWVPNSIPNIRQNPVAILQLCVGRQCLIYQLAHCYGYIPQSLRDFLNDTRNTFMGVGVDNDVEKLYRDYGVQVARTMELGWLANLVGMTRERQPALTTLIREIMHIRYEKPRNITLSGWDEVNLSPDQVQYACIDAFVSYEIGRILRPMLQS